MKNRLYFFVSIVIASVIMIISAHVKAINEVELKDHASYLSSLEKNDIKKLIADFNEGTVRKWATCIIDALKIPDGDLALPSDNVHSKRYVITKWQRIATGASIIIAYIDKHHNDDIYVVLGKQRGVIRNPQGYMEVPLPKADLTGFKAKKESRAGVKHDFSIEDNAIREIYEETGLKIEKNKLRLLNVSTEIEANPITLTVSYMVLVDSMLNLKTCDTEFAHDDLRDPKWVKLTDIEFDKAKGKHFLNGVCVEDRTISLINLASKNIISSSV
jgi:8-oxo-dGTP pyrophosphatase MutT (NUDIX family)